MYKSSGAVVAWTGCLGILECVQVHNWIHSPIVQQTIQEH